MSSARLPNAVHSNTANHEIVRRRHLPFFNPIDLRAFCKTLRDAEPTPSSLSERKPPSLRPWQSETGRLGGFVGGYLVSGFDFSCFGGGAGCDACWVAACVAGAGRDSCCGAGRDSAASGSVRGDGAGWDSDLGAGADRASAWDSGARRDSARGSVVACDSVLGFSVGAI